MKSVLEVVVDSVVGAARVERSDAGVTFHRLPTRPGQPLDPVLGFVASITSGVTLRFDTDASMLEFDWFGRQLHTRTDLDPRDVVVDVLVDGTRTAPLAVPGLTLFVVDLATMQTTETPRERAPMRLQLPGDGAMHRVELWLPHIAGAGLSDVRAPSDAVLRPAPDTRRRWVHYGSSISQCGEADSPAQTWPAIVAQRADVRLTSLGLAGQCQLDRIVADHIATLPADFISLKLGINIVNGDTMRERTFVPAVHAFLDTVRAGHPTTPILVVSPIHCPIAEDRPGPTVPGTGALLGKFVSVDRPASLNDGALTLQRIRVLLELIVAGRQLAGDSNLHFLQGTELFGQADEHLLPDDLHPDNEGYALMGERFFALAHARGLL